MDKIIKREGKTEKERFLNYIPMIEFLLKKSPLEPEFVAESIDILKKGVDNFADQLDDEIKIIDFKTVGQDVYSYMKKVDLWTLDEGISMLTGHPIVDNYLNPNPRSLFLPHELLMLDLKIFIRAIESGRLKVKGYDPEKIENWEPDHDFYKRVYKALKRSNLSEYRCPGNEKNDPNSLPIMQKNDFWDDCLAKLTVAPFEFLEFMKEKAMFEIPKELGFIKKILKSGEIQYFWVSDIEKNNSPKALNETDKKNVLDNLLIESREDVDILYESLKRILKLKKKSLFDTNKEDVLEAFSRIENRFNSLIADDINNRIDSPNKPTRDIKGKIISCIVERLLPETMIDKSIKTDYQSLYDRSTDLKNNPPKK